MGTALRVLAVGLALAACAGSTSVDVRHDRPPGTLTVATTARGTTTTSAEAATAPPSTAPAPDTSTTTTRPQRTRCRALAHIGDSITVAMTGAALPPDARLDAQYSRVGVSDPLIDASGARSIVETLPGQVSAYDAAIALRDAGFVGCWVIQVGTNDAANIAAGSRVDQATRIDRMMSVVGSDPVLWVDAISLVRSGDYARTNMQRWDDALADARRRYPALQVFAWSTEARDEWFLPDGVHYTAEGYTVLARSVADALVAALPA